MGMYVLIADDQRAGIGPAGVPLSATAGKWWVFANNGCHVYKVSGPDTLVLGP